MTDSVHEPSDVPPKARPRLPLTIVLLGLTSFFTDVGGEMIFALLPAFLTDVLHAQPAYLGLVEGAADTVASMLKLGSGYLADHLKRKKPLVIIGYALTSAARPLMAIAAAPWQVLVVRVSDRVGKGIRSSPRDALIADAAGDTPGRAFGFHRAMDHAGAIVGPVLGFLLAEICGLEIRTVFWVAIVPGAIATLLLFFVREGAFRPPVAPDQGAFRTAAAGPAPAREPPARLPASLKQYLAILLVFSLGNSSDAFVLLRAKDHDMSPLAVWAVLHVAKFVSSYVAGDLSDRVPRTNLVLIGWVVYAASYAGFGLAAAPWQMWALVVVYGFYYGLTEPAEKALVRDLAPQAARGRAFGLYNLVIGITALPAGILTGELWRVSAALALGVSAGLAALSALLLVVWRSVRR
jgi:MFS family permease